MSDRMSPPRRMRFSYQSRCSAVEVVAASTSTAAAAAAAGASRASG